MNEIANNFSAYLPLDPALEQIRILILHPGPKSAELCCSLAYTSLGAADHKKYEAVSYCWGDINDVESIKLNGRSFVITKSAGGALRAFRQEKEERSIWLDAICINQQDGEERGAQVSMMGEIYRAAVRALVWLGEDDGTFGDAKALMIALLRQMRDAPGMSKDPNGEQIWNVLKDHEWESNLHRADIRTHGIPPYDSAAWDALEQFFCRPWFTRTWVIQEIVLSQRPIAFCGGDQLEWVIIEMAASWITKQRYDARSQRAGLRRAKNVSMVWLFARESSLHSLLLLTRDFQSTDPKDKIFGLLSLATDCRDSLPVELKPSYLNSTSRVFSDATKYMIRASQSLDVLSHIGFVAPFKETSGSSGDCPFPSWVPRWDLTEPAGTWDELNTVFWGRPEHPFSVSGPSAVDLDTINGDADSIVLQGFRVDRIKGMSSIIDSGKLAETDMAISIWNTYANGLMSYPTGEKLLRAFSLTMVADSTLNKNPASLDSQHDLDFAAYISARGGGLDHLSKDDQSLLISNALKGDEIRYRAAATNATTGRSFCTTESGWMGICPPTARTGDLICLLFGGAHFYIIRRERKRSRFVGECYVHGRMDGSALDDQLRTNAPAEAFRLC